MLITVKIVDISLSNFGFVVFLKAEDDNKTLPIFIGVPEAQAIAVQHNKLKTPRPLTHDLLKNILDLLDVKIIKIVVNDLIDSTFYAKVYFEKNEEKFLVDARPSDAIALALRFEIPIFVHEKVMKEGAVLIDNSKVVKEEVEAQTKTQLEILQEQLSQAVKEERYEEAARIRDEIKKFSENN